jgi:hypothetical protein
MLTKIRRLQLSHRWVILTARDKVSESMHTNHTTRKQAVFNHAAEQARRPDTPNTWVRVKYQDISKNQAALMLAGIGLSYFCGAKEVAVSMVKLK